MSLRSSSRVYCLPEPTISTADMMMPGVQKPHWTAASSTKARWMGERPPSGSWRPSTVRMVFPWAHTDR